MQPTKDKEALSHLYNKVLPPLAERIYQHLTQITPLFDDFGLEKLVDTWTRDPNASSGKEISLDNGNVLHMGLRLQLTGFQGGNVPPFDLRKDLLFTLGYSSYEVGPDKNSPWIEKPYLQPWNAPEMEELAERWCGELIDDISAKLQTPES